jgi:hypothetical protein
MEMAWLSARVSVRRKPDNMANCGGQCSDTLLRPNAHWQGGVSRRLNREPLGGMSNSQA